MPAPARGHALDAPPVGKYGSIQFNGRSPDAESGPLNPRPAALLSQSRPSRTSSSALSWSTNRLSAVPSAPPVNAARPLSRRERSSIVPAAPTVAAIVRPRSSPGRVHR